MDFLDTLSIAFHNVDNASKKIGSQSFCKLDCHSYQESLCKHDIVFLAETHCGQKDSLSLPGFHIWQNQRIKTPGAPRTFGGLAICIKKSIKNGIELLTPTNSEISWIKLSKSFFNLDRDIFMAVIYAAPAFSYAPIAVDVFETLENDLATYLPLGSCFLCGDFNARICTENDFCTDEHQLPIANFEKYILDQPLRRKNSDPHTSDLHGKKLLSLCKTTGVRIINGRTFGDYFGQCTCFSHNGSPSLIDYMLADEELLKNIECFNVKEPSDISIHCLLSCVIKLNAPIHVQTLDSDASDAELVPEFMWNTGDDQRFTEALYKTSSRQLINDLTQKIQSMTVNKAVDNLTDSIVTIAKLAKIKQKRSFRLSYKTKKHPKPSKRFAWFDRECLDLRSLFRKSCTQVRLNPYDRFLLHDFKNLRSRYKKLLNAKKRSHTQGIINQLENLEESNPSAFWKLFNKLKGAKSNHGNQISIQDWVNMFSTQMNGNSNIDPTHLQEMNEFVNKNKNSVFNNLNITISPDEVSSAIHKLKRGKACGPDLILNEMLKVGHEVLLPALHKLFNKVLSNAEFPNSWRTNFLTPIHKKGDRNDPSNYRGIAVGSHLGKLFCSILHERLVKFSNEHNLIPNHQIGFKKGSRPADHILTLKTLIEKYAIGLKKYLYSCFIDFKSAFDSISREALIYKLLSAEVGGNFLNVIQSLYSGVNFSIKVKNSASQTFDSRIGVKQGCILSPLLFNLYVRDIPNIFQGTCDPVVVSNYSFNCLMYADDLVLFSQSAKGLQNCIDALSTYCNKWGLSVNLSKTKVMIFNKSGHFIKKHNFTINNNTLETSNSYNYLGILFTPSGKFKSACERLCDQASKAIFKLKQLDLRNNIALALKLFNCLIRPILLYGSEVWGPYYAADLSEENIISKSEALPAEKILLRYCKFLLGVRRNSSNQAVRGELGQYGLLSTILPQSIKYWFSICKLDSSFLVKQAYLTSADPQAMKGWASHLKHLLRSNWLEEAWSNQGSQFQTRDTKIFKNCIRSMFESGWLKLIQNNSDGQRNNQLAQTKLRSYGQFKNSLQMENYLLFSSDLEHRREFTKLRISAHKLRIETGRHSRIPAELRLCTNCSLQEIENERHFVLQCPKYNIHREELFSKLDDFTTFAQMSDEERFVFLMNYNNGDLEVLKLFSQFLSKSLAMRGS